MTQISSRQSDTTPCEAGGHPEGRPDAPVEWRDLGLYCEDCYRRLMGAGAENTRLREALERAEVALTEPVAPDKLLVSQALRIIAESLRP